MTERTYAVRALKSLVAGGWSITGVYDGGEDIIEGTRTPTQAVEDVMAAELGFVQVEHPTHGQAAIHLLFQGGEAEEVIYDVSAKSTETLDLIDQVLTTFQGA